MSKLFKAIKMTIKHRYGVFRLCCKCGLPWRGITHDLSKYSWVEFRERDKYYSSDGSPLDISKEINGRSPAMEHHLRKNKHHFGYWYDASLEEQPDIPYPYLVEMICDMITATKNYHKNNSDPKIVYDYWLKHDPGRNTNDRVKAFITQVLRDYSVKGVAILNKKYLKSTYESVFGLMK